MTDTHDQPTDHANTRDAERPSGLIERGRAAKEKKPRLIRHDRAAADIMHSPNTSSSGAHLAYRHTTRHAKDGVTDAMRRRMRRLAREVTLLMASVEDVPQLSEPHDFGPAITLAAAPVQTKAQREPTRPNREDHGRERGRDRGFER